MILVKVCENEMINASCEDWTHDSWFTRPVLYHWAKEAVITIKRGWKLVEVSQSKILRTFMTYEYIKRFHILYIKHLLYTYLLCQAYSNMKSISLFSAYTTTVYIKIIC